MTMTIGEKIKQLRCQIGLTQEELATAANTTKQTIHKYETGIIANIPASKIKAIADKLNTTPSYLMGWEDNYLIMEEPSFKIQTATAFNTDGTPDDRTITIDPEKIQELYALLNSARDLTVEQIQALKQLADNLKK